MVRALHFTDVHVVAPYTSIPLRDWLGKRLLGGVNAVLRRNRRFAAAVHKLGRLAELVREEGIELVLCTGDYTTLGTEVEYAVARAALEPLLAAPLGYVHVPGNHDLYLPDTVRDGRFERVFADTLHTDLPEYCAPGQRYPLVRLVGDDVAVVAVQSARPNPQPWRSSGRVPAAELEALARALDDPRVRDRFVFVLTHYAPRRQDGTPDRRLHGLENAEELLAVCRGIARGAILHGHIHHCFELTVPGLSARIFDAGSTTYDGREGLWVFDVDGRRATATRGRWDGQRYVLDREATHPI
jgi:hypothetical protein